MFDPISDLFDDIDNFLKTSEDNPSLFEDNEIERLITSLAISRGDDGFYEEEVVEVVRWAEKVRVESMMLGFILDGTCDVDWIDNEVTIKLTQLGKHRLDDARS